MSLQDTARIELGSKATGFYFGTPEDHLVIWEEGMELPPADEETEREWTRSRILTEQEWNALTGELGDYQDSLEPTLDEETE